MSVSEDISEKVQPEYLAQATLGNLLALPGQFAKKGGDAVEKTRAALERVGIGLVYMGHDESKNVVTYPLQQRVDDAVYALTEMRNHSDLPLGILGSSLGNVVMLAAADRYLDQGSLAILVGKSPVPGIEAAEKNTKFLVSAFTKGYDGPLTTDEFRHVVEKARAAGTEVYAIAGTADDQIPLDNVFELYTPDVTFVEGADHAFSQADHFNTMLRLLVDKAKRAFQR